MSHYQQYSEAFKAKAIQQVTDGESVKAVASKLGISPQSISRWMRAKERKTNLETHADQTLKELDSLRQQLQQVEQERDHIRQERDSLKKDCKNLLDTIAIISRQR